MTGRPGVALHDVQGNILRPYRLAHASYGFVRFSDPASAQAWVARLAPLVTTAEAWGPGDKPTTLNLAFTAAGLRGLGVPDATLAAFPEEFRSGMSSRAGLLGDTGPDAPLNWERPQWVSGEVHAMVAIHATTQERIGARWAEIDGGHGPGVTVLFRDEAWRLPGDKEHFGYTDGFGQPLLDAEVVGRPGVGDQYPGQGTPDGRGGWRPVALGEFLLGHLDEEELLPPAPPPQALSDNGTFLIYRKLYQDVFAFRQWTAGQAAQLGWEAARVGASIVGRWPDGSPLALRPQGPDRAFGADKAHNNDFTYGADPQGFGCPVGAHVRRANPRDALGFKANFLQHKLGFRPEQLVSRHRMIRRGITYGPSLPEQAGADDGQDRGLLFMCAVASPARQFEFVQNQWLNTGNIFHLGDDRDVLAGEQDGTGKMTVQGRPPRFLSSIPKLVTMRGGDYFFKPGLGGLRWLGQLGQP